MKRCPALAALYLCLHTASPAYAMFGLYQLTQVPVARVLLNLEKRLAANTNDVDALYSLARVHSMAYATNLQEVPIIRTDKSSPEVKPFTPSFEYPWDLEIPKKILVPKNPADQLAARQHLTNAISFYQRARQLAFKSATNHSSVLPIALGYAWCLEQAGDLRNAKDAYREALRWAWQAEVEGDFTFKERAQWAWDQLKNRKNPLKHLRRQFLGPGPCYTEEIITSLLRLLDPVKDASEIAKLKDAQTELLAMGRAITPILISLNPDLQLDELIDHDAAVPFDLDGTALGRTWQWITPNAAWLVYDNDNSGKITSGLQLFGSVTFWIFWHNGYEPLAALDDDGNGLLEGDELRHLSLWRDLNQNGISDPGEVQPLANFGIIALETHPEGASNETLSNTRGAHLANGTFLPTIDWIAQQTEKTDFRAQSP